MAATMAVQAGLIYQVENNTASAHAAGIGAAAMLFVFISLSPSLFVNRQKIVNANGQVCVKLSLAFFHNLSDMGIMKF